jgi:hypothetical protein
MHWHVSKDYDVKYVREYNLGNWASCLILFTWNVMLAGIFTLFMVRTDATFLPKVNSDL